MWVISVEGVELKSDDMEVEEFMGDYKFDQFYYTEDESSEHYLSEIEGLSENEYIRLYKGRMKCPECKGPQLSLVKKEGNAFLRTYPNHPHVLVAGKKCIYECDTASKQVMEEYVKELREKKKIKSLLEATMRKLFKQDTESNVRPTISGNKSSNPLLIERIQNDSTVKRNIVPHYSFKSWGKNIPQERLLIVYGKVYIELKEIRKKDKNGDEIRQVYIHFKDMQTRKLITSCLKPQTLEIGNGNYYAVILGECRKNESKGYTYYNMWINYPVDDSILLTPYQL